MTTGNRNVATILLFFAASLSALAAPPTLDVPPEVRPAGGYVRFTPKTDGVSVTYVGLSGVESFPSEELKDGKRFLLPTQNLKDGRYKFAAVAAGKGGEQTRADFVVIVGAPPEVAPDPKPKPKDPATPPTTGLYFLIVGGDGPALPAVTRCLQLPEWATLVGAGHVFNYKTATEAAKLGIRLPAGTPLPLVVVLQNRADGKSTQLGTAPLPATGADVLALPNAVK